MPSSPGSRRCRSGIELFRYDNRANPEDRERRPRMGLADRASTMSALVADLGSGAELKAQAHAGPHPHGLSRWPERRWVDDRFRSAFVLLTEPVRHVRHRRSRGRVRHAQSRQPVGERI